VSTPEAVHVFYGGAHLVQPGLLDKLRRNALRALARQADLLEWNESFTARVAARLTAQPIEDLRIDFEDGFGARPPAVAHEFARSLKHFIFVAGTLPHSWGIRTRPLACDVDKLTLRIFLDDPSTTPPIVTLPKVQSPLDVRALTTLLDEHNAPSRIELLIETPAALTHLPALIDAAGPRLQSLHFGAYDFLSALGVPAPDQRLDHPFCDHARFALQMATAGTPVRVYDGVTTLLPVDPDPRPGWHLHTHNIRRALAQGIYSGWDVHPAQVAARYAALYTYFDEHKPDAATRLTRYLDQQAQATRSGATFDDAASVRGLVRFFARALACAAFTEDEVSALLPRPWAEIAPHA